MKTTYVIVSVILVWITCSTFEANAYTNQPDSRVSAIYLIRHAEKASNAKDKRNPPLSDCGIKRAHSLATLFKDIDLKAVYSTDYLRTQLTAKPVAIDKNLKVLSYKPRELKLFAQQLIFKQQNALVVGHSNTTNVLAGYLVGKELEQINEKIYDRVY